MLTWIGNVITGRFRHWNNTNNAQFTKLWERCAHLSPAMQIVFEEFLLASLSLVDLLLGPDKGRARLLRIDSLNVAQEQFVRLHCVQIAFVAGQYAALNKSMRSYIEDALKAVTASDAASLEIFRSQAEMPINLNQSVPALWKYVVMITDSPVEQQDEVSLLTSYPYTVLFGEIVAIAYRKAQARLRLLDSTDSDDRHMESGAP